jgi:hypothetical protein
MKHYLVFSPSSFRKVIIVSVFLFRSRFFLAPVFELV